MNSGARALPSRRVLMIAYIFPPIGGSAVYRNLSFARYLPEYGWQPVVVCGDGETLGHGMDLSLLRSIPPEVVVVRRPFVSAFGLRRAAKRLLGVQDPVYPSSLPGDQCQVTNLRGPLPSDPIATGAAARRILGALALPLQPIEHPLPDAALYWALSIIPTSLRLIRERQIDAILSESFPYSDHLAGLVVHRLTGKPWIADFHDPWSLNAAFRHRGVRRWFDVAAERRVLQRATRVIACTPPNSEGLRELAPGRVSGDFVTIPEGFDSRDLEMARRASGDGPPPWSNAPARRTLAHVGFVVAGAAIALLRALEGLEHDAAGRLRVVFVGGLALPDARWLRDHPVPVEIQVTPRVSQAQALHAMLAADALLLLLPPGEGWSATYPGKLFNYMASGKPILYVGPQGAASRLVQESGTGCVAPASDPALARILLRELALTPAEFEQRNYHPRQEVIAQYERRVLASRLAAVLDEAVAAGRGKARAS